ncbi:hypothetical protein HNQ60_001418 [Povalibacter uvarum]|uniref:DUF3325 domain-containing protein n=1 Tax=Povalibacter uvarum TaxID=732238 RepID=A0A841HJR6_9GAMM|nr:DUF3325 domain-containing protein [Povalibacter uvarum]MBB6092540.1 hypothetical protein [Povalibacter uvarum]
MRDPALLAVAAICCILSFSWLALAMDVHWQQVRETSIQTIGVKRMLRVLAVVALGVSLSLCLKVDHGSMASLVWVMLLALAALIVTFTLSWRPRVLAPLVAWIPNVPRAGVGASS